MKLGQVIINKPCTGCGGTGKVGCAANIRCNDCQGKGYVRGYN